MLDLSFLDGFFKYLAQNLGGAFTIVIGSLITEIVKKIVNDIVLPLSNGRFDQIKQNVNVREYIGILINFIITVYILYNIFEWIKHLDE
jgi:large-conductance mechanosensitive channel